tara:strand:- start:1581 stop:4325 length:2745 start_codon:yes stop_codon:yes gene_type:complete
MKKGVIVLVGLFLIGFVVAGVSIGDSDGIEESYGPEDSIRGWINISLSDESGSGLLEDSEGNSISLINLLTNQTTYDYDCLPSSCQSAYSESSPETDKSFDLNIGASKLVGFKLTGALQRIVNVTFNAQSDAYSSCYNQLEFDFLNDGSFEKGNTNSAVGGCGILRSYGCHDESKESGNSPNIGETPYCQRVELSESPGFKLGAWVEKSGSNSTISMHLKNIFGENIEGTTCTLPGATNPGSEIFCEIDFLVTESEDYYVCISADSSTDYKIKGYDDPDGCGFFDLNVGDEEASYRIFAEGKNFGPVGDLTIHNTLPNDNVLSAYIEDYVSNNYENSDCSSGCIIPLKVRSGQNQDIVLNGLNLKYQTSTGILTSDTFYDLEESSPIINSDFGELPLDNGGFLVPSDFGNYTFVLDFNEDQIISKNVFVEQVPVIVGVSPTLTVSALPTEFEVKVDSSSSIVNYFWDFGDGTEESSSENKTTHAYNSTGTYNLEIEARDSNDKSSSKTFVITVGDPRETIAQILEEKEDNLETIKNQINGFNDFYKTELDLIIDSEDLNNKLKDLRRRYQASFVESDYNPIMTELFNLKVPSYIGISKKSNPISFNPSEENINLDVLGEIEQGSYGSGQESLYKEAILIWNLENLETKISFDEISATYDDSSEFIGKFYQVTINKKEGSSLDPYLVIKNLEGLKFKQNYFENEESGYTHIELKDDSESIGFFTTEEIGLNELPVFISPGLDRLSIVDPSIDEEPLKIKWALMFLVLALVIILGFVVYIVAQEWYRKKYENYLFRDQTNLYNLVYYIDNSKKKGKSEGEVVRNLAKAGWKREQIRYAIKKHAGRRTGMLEIPVNKILVKLRKKGVKVPKPVKDARKAVETPPRAVPPSQTPPKIPPRMMPHGEPSPKNREMFFKK